MPRQLAKVVVLVLWTTTIASAFAQARSFAQVQNQTHLHDSLVANESKSEAWDLPSPLLGEDQTSEIKLSDLDPILPSTSERLSGLAFDEMLEQGHLRRLASVIVQDHLNFYSRDSLLLMGSGFAVAGVFANTTLDERLQERVEDWFDRSPTDERLAGRFPDRQLGDGAVMAPIFASAWLLGSLLPESRYSEATRVWGQRSLRGFIIGGPAVLVTQVVTGASRPHENSHSSHWAIFRDTNGVSGHSFLGALPFITAAKMTKSRTLKFFFYSASLYEPLSRTVDSAHYPSQSALGWWVAYLAASAVQATDNPHTRWRVFPITTERGSGMAVEFAF